MGRETLCYNAAKKAHSFKGTSKEISQRNLPFRVKIDRH